MIVGLGQDLLEIKRLRKTYERHGRRFLEKIYTPEEVAYALQHRDPVPRLAARFAAKEAVAKALGSGVAEGIEWREIEVLLNAAGAPQVALHGTAAARARALGITRWHLTLTHCDTLAGATAIAEGEHK
jgi:holo-[acyl-carrier protein] synthase